MWLHITRLSLKCRKVEGEIYVVSTSFRELMNVILLRDSSP